MSNDRIVIREPRLELGTDREVPTSLIGEQAYDWLAIHHPQTNAAAVRDGNAAAVDQTVAQSTAMADVHKPAVAAAQADPVQQQEPHRIAVGAR